MSVTFSGRASSGHVAARPTSAGETSARQTSRQRPSARQTFPRETQAQQTSPREGGKQESPQPTRRVREEVRDGRQAYVVCPLVEESEKLEVASATETYEQLAADQLAGLRVGLLHGRMKGEEKEAVMGAFRARELDVLVATTVIEVGVDVPNATVMVVLDADRFGIAQACLMPSHSYARPRGTDDLRALNDAVAQLQQGAPDRFPVALGTTSGANTEGSSAR